MHLNKKGMTLIELMIVVAILGILAGIAIPTYLGVQKKGKRTEYITNLNIIRLLEEKERAETGLYAAGANTAALMAALPDFKPGDPSSTTPGSDGYLYYDYLVNVGATGQTFTIQATGKAGTFDAGQTYCLNQDNEADCSAP